MSEAGIIEITKIISWTLVAMALFGLLATWVKEENKSGINKKEDKEE